MENNQLTDRQLLEAILDAAEEKNDLLHNIADNQHKIMDHLKTIMDSMGAGGNPFGEEALQSLQSVFPSANPNTGAAVDPKKLMEDAMKLFQSQKRPGQDKTSDII